MRLVTINARCLMIAATLGGLAGFAGTAYSETLAGVPEIGDADTVTIDGQRIRLEGIDAPESKQHCERPTRDPRRAATERYACGQAATEALKQRIAGRAIACTGNERDRYGRLLGICRLQNEDLNAWLVRNGHALAYRRYSRKYIAEEEKARNERRGVWAGSFVKPWDWRRGKRLNKDSRS